MEITYSHIVGGGPNLHYTCDRCGAAIIDWRKANGEPTQARPNQDKHTAWHQSIEG